MAYFEIIGLPVRAAADHFGPTVGLTLEQGRGLSLVADDEEFPRAVAGALLGTGGFSGEIILNGRRIDPIRAADRPVKALGQTGGIVPHRTVRENLESAVQRRGASEGEAAMLVERELADGGLAGLDEVPAGSLHSAGRTILAASRILLAGCDLLLITRLPVPGSPADRSKKIWGPGLELDTLLDLKGVLRRLRATWVNFLTDPACVHILSDRLAVFSAGRLVQEGPLRECINAPATRLVADFLAFPRMNYRTARVERDGPFLMLRSGRYGFRVSEYIKRSIASREGEDVVVGLRPEDLGLRPYETGDPTVMNLARVLRVDAIPGALAVVVDLEGEEWVGLTEPGRPFFTGQLVELRPDPDKLHLFHPLQGTSLLD
jgi:multiple sugar transport system ATP-binding protein